MSDPRDPGWPLDAKMVLMILTFPAWTWWVKRNRESELVVLRRMHIALLTSVVIFGVVILLILPEPGSLSWFPLAVIAGASALFLYFRATFASLPTRLPEVGVDQTRLVAMFRVIYLLPAGIATSISSSGVAFSFIVDASWPYIVAAPISLVCLWSTGPTSSRIDALQRALSAKGMQVDLLGALLAPSPQQDVS